MEQKKSNRTNDILIRLDEKMLEVLRRIDGFDKVIVPRGEFTIIVNELRSKHIQNQKDIESMQQDLRTMMVRLGTGLGALNVVTAIALYLITRGA